MLMLMLSILGSVLPSVPVGLEALTIAVTGEEAGGDAEGFPLELPRFYLEGHEREAQVIRRFLWDHLQSRPGSDHSVFNREYLVLADMWLGSADLHIQEAQRAALLAIRLDEEGYAYTPMISHAHDHGWTFPLWTQSGLGHVPEAGKTAGWHFQELSAIPGPANWVPLHLERHGDDSHYGEKAAELWDLENARSNGVSESRWHIESTGRSPAILTPEGVEIDATNAPFLQLRWNRTGSPKHHALPYVEWLRSGDAEFGADRRVYFPTEEPSDSHGGYSHSIIGMFHHPKWTGTIKRLRLSLAPGESDIDFEISSFYTVYDTRHNVNNPIFVLASCHYFAWTGDLSFLKKNISRMRLALMHQQTVMGGLEHNHIRTPWIGHDGVSGFRRNDDGTVAINAGHGIGNNYWDLLPFGWDDFYATSYYYAATLAMADMEEAIAQHPEWGAPQGVLSMMPERLRAHAQDVKRTANELFWDGETRRFVACIDEEGHPHDYGYTFVNLGAIWYGIATHQHAADIMEWIAGERIVDGDTSVGDDIYRWRFGPRASTRRNIEWSGQVWTKPESIPWGDQVQDGGAVLGFSFFDLWSRLQVLGPDNAWQRFVEILEWQREVNEAGGYRPYYEKTEQGGTLQGAGTPGGLGMDAEFRESRLLPSIVIYGFMGILAGPQGLTILPCLPQACPEMGVDNLLYHAARMNVRVRENEIHLSVLDTPTTEIELSLDGTWHLEGFAEPGSRFTLAVAGDYVFRKTPSPSTTGHGELPSG